MFKEEAGLWRWGGLQGETGRAWGPWGPRKEPQTCHSVILSDRTTLIKSYLYLTSVGLISGGIGRRGPESGCAPGGGAGGRGGRALMVLLLSCFYHFVITFCYHIFGRAVMLALLSFFHHFVIIFYIIFLAGLWCCIVLIFSGGFSRSGIHLCTH